MIRPEELVFWLKLALKNLESSLLLADHVCASDSLLYGVLLFLFGLLGSQIFLQNGALEVLVVLLRHEVVHGFFVELSSLDESLS